MAHLEYPALYHDLHAIWRYTCDLVDGILEFGRRQIGVQLNVVHLACMLYVDWYCHIFGAMDVVERERDSVGRVRWLGSRVYRGKAGLDVTRLRLCHTLDSLQDDHLVRERGDFL